MNKFQKRESKLIHRMIVAYPGSLYLESNYKIARRKVRKTARLFMKTNQKAHKEAIRGMDLANGRDQTAYIRRDLFNTICIAKPIEVKNE